MRYDGIKMKLYILTLSLLLAAFTVLMYFSDTSLFWGAEKIILCVFSSLWMFFTPASLRGFYVANKDRDIAFWFRVGYIFGRYGIIMAILVAPFFGMKYYLNIE